jgi:hypothetical protein
LAPQALQPTVPAIEVDGQRGRLPLAVDLDRRAEITDDTIPCPQIPDACRK